MSKIKRWDPDPLYEERRTDPVNPSLCSECTMISCQNDICVQVVTSWDGVRAARHFQGHFACRLTLYAFTSFRHAGNDNVATFVMWHLLS